MFASREDAGQKLARHLKQEGVQGDLVVGLPRGGVVVAAEAAHELHLPLDVVIVRKIGHPWHREFAVGALAENGVVVLDEGVIGRNPLIRADLEDIIDEERDRLRMMVSPQGRPPKPPSCLFENKMLAESPWRHPLRRRTRSSVFKGLPMRFVCCGLIRSSMPWDATMILSPKRPTKR